MNYKNKTKIIIFLLFINFLIFTFHTQNIQAATQEKEYAPLQALEVVAVGLGKYANVEETSLLTNIATVVAGLLSLLGILFLVLILIGGYQWMTAGGNEETITKARKRIINATIGLAIIALAYALHIFVIKMLL